MNKGRNWPSTKSKVLNDACNSSNGWRIFDEIYRPLIFEYCKRRGFQATDASDITQDVLCLIYQQFEKKKFVYDRSRGRFRGWAAMIARQQIARFLKKKPSNPTSEPHLLDSKVSTGFSECLYEEAFEQALEQVKQQFDEKKWQVYEIDRSEKLPAKEVGLQLGITALQVHKIRYQINQALREAILKIADNLLE